jgi:hypothetical protein
VQVVQEPHHPLHSYIHIQVFFYTVQCSGSARRDPGASRPGTSPPPPFLYTHTGVLLYSVPDPRGGIQVQVVQKPHHPLHSYIHKVVLLNSVPDSRGGIQVQVVQDQEPHHALHSCIHLSCSFKQCSGSARRDPGASRPGTSPPPPLFLYTHKVVLLNSVPDPRGGIRVQVVQEPHHPLHSYTHIKLFFKTVFRIREEGSRCRSSRNLTTPSIPIHT